MTFDVRVAMATDLDAVVALEREIAEAPHWRREEYARLLEEESESAMRHVLFVATVGGRETVGFAVGKVIGLGLDSVGALESVAVGEKARRSGVGRALCEAVVGWCRKQGAGVVELEVRRRSEGARALYAQLGFVEVGVRSGYYREPDDDAVLMSRVD